MIVGAGWTSSQFVKYGQGESYGFDLTAGTMIAKGKVLEDSFTPINLEKGPMILLYYDGLEKKLYINPHDKHGKRSFTIEEQFTHDFQFGVSISGSIEIKMRN